MSKVHGNLVRWAGAGKWAIPCLTVRNKLLSNTLQHLTKRETIHAATPTWWKESIAHCSWAHEHNTWQLLKAGRATYCNWRLSNVLLSIQVKNIWLKIFLLFSMSFGKIFVMITLLNSLPKALPVSSTDVAPVRLRKKLYYKYISSEYYNIK